MLKITPLGLNDGCLLIRELLKPSQKTHTLSKKFILFSSSENFESEEDIFFYVTPTVHILL